MAGEAPVLNEQQTAMIRLAMSAILLSMSLPRSVCSTGDGTACLLPLARHPTTEEQRGMYQADRLLCSAHIGIEEIENRAPTLLTIQEKSTKQAAATQVFLRDARNMNALTVIDHVTMSH
jgi:hypothetical protein